VTSWSRDRGPSIKNKGQGDVIEVAFFHAFTYRDLERLRSNLIDFLMKIESRIRC
jgi:hypothetical protein